MSKLKSIINVFITGFLACLALSGCQKYPDDVRIALKYAGDHRKELESVIRHYQKPADSLKLKAAYFLIGSMPYKYSLEGDQVVKFDILFDSLQKMHSEGIPVNYASPVLKQKWDAIVTMLGSPSSKDAEIKPDIINVKAGFIIENIDLAFEAYQKAPWRDRVDFEMFCEYILPYRVGNERIENWRKYLYEKSKSFYDTTAAKGSRQFSTGMNRAIGREYQNSIQMMEYPFDIPVSKMEIGRRGACRHLVDFVVLTLRANGLPAVNDFIYLYGDQGGGHSWVAFLDDDGSFGNMHAASTWGDDIGFGSRFAKAFRSTYSYQRNLTLPPKEDAPESMLDPFRIDVTNQYSKTVDIAIPLNFRDEEKNCAIICTFDGENMPSPQYWGMIRGDSAYFEDMGVNLVYHVYYYSDGRLTPAISSPFLLRDDGGINYLQPGDYILTGMALKRKFPARRSMLKFMSSMKNGIFEGANKPDFSDATKLYQIPEAPEHVEKVEINDYRRFRYIRYLSADEQGCRRGNVGEIEFYGGARRKLSGRAIGFPEMHPEGNCYSRALDGDLNTYFDVGNNETRSWVGLDLGKPERITRIVFCPRSDTNFIEEGHTYELHYWNDEEWVSLGTKIPTEPVVVYDSVPSNVLFLLKNRTKGKEERIFMYENGAQIWY